MQRRQLHPNRVVQVLVVPVPAVPVLVVPVPAVPVPAVLVLVLVLRVPPVALRALLLAPQLRWGRPEYKELRI